VTEHPELEEFQRQITALAGHPLVKRLLRKGEVSLQKLTLEQIEELAHGDAGYYFLVGAAGLNRTTLKAAMRTETAPIVAKRLRRAFAIKQRLPVRRRFDEIIHTAIALRGGDLRRRSMGAIEGLFRERLVEEGIPLLMSPPIRQVPGLLIAKRKPDGVYPDPATGRPPELYLEIKNIRRVADDIQKRLYEIAEASLEMKLLYGTLKLQGLGIADSRQVLSNASKLRARIRKQITASPPAVVVLMLCSRAEAERYREPAETFVDRVFFQEEIEECLAYLKAALATVGR
jgi:hypothetical protein